MAVSDASPYLGRDGEWLDARILASALGASVPTLTRRVRSPRPWPPPLTSPHPNGVCGLRELHLATGEPEYLLALLTLLGAQRHADDELSFGNAVRVLVAPAAGRVEGPVSIVLDRGRAPPLQLSVAG